MLDSHDLTTDVVSSFSDGAAPALVVVPLISQTSTAAESLPESVHRALERAGNDATADADSVVLIHQADQRLKRVLFVGVGDQEKLDHEAYRVAAGKAADKAMELECEDVSIYLERSAAEYAQAVVEGFWLGAYRYRRYKTDKGKKSVKRLVLVGEAEALSEPARIGQLLSHAVYTVRDLVNRSPDEKTAEAFAEMVQQSGERHGYGVEVWNADRIEDEGMGGLLAVNRGSEDPPTFSVLSWKPDSHSNAQPIVLVGKGVMYDTGGLSLKDTKDSMDLMKSDMAGAATVVGVFEALAALDIPLHVIGLVPATDNRPGGRAYVPGDVVRMHSGSTVEVLNTDAEGRLLLADALSYAQSLEPELVVDLATLTGAAVIALGHQASPFMTNETSGQDERADQFRDAASATGEPVHPLPMYEAYASALESSVADLKNVGGRAAGSITAGKFLEHFVDYPWVHIDIAGTAFLQEAKPYRPVGGTGFGVRLLIQLLRRRASS